MTLIYIPKPFKDESAASLIIRATGRNGYRTTSSLLKAYGINVYTTSLNSYFFDTEKFRIVLQNLSLNENYKILAPSNYGPTKKIKKFYNNMIIYENFLSPDGSKLCCYCIKENNYLKINWMVKYLTICTKHKSKLLENCPQCKSPLDSNRNTINICNYCDYDFQKIHQDEEISPIEINANLWLIDIIEKNDLFFLKKVKSFFDIINNTRKNFKDLYLPIPNIVLGYLFFKKIEDYKTYFLNFINNNSSLAHPRILAIYFISCYQDISHIHEKILSEIKNYRKNKIYNYHNILLSQRTACIALKICKTNFRKNYFPEFDSTSKISSKLIENYIINKKKLLKLNELPNIYCDAKKLAKLLSIDYRISCILLKKSKIFNLEIITFNSRKTTVTKLKNVKIFNKKYITVHSLAASINVPTTNLYSKLLSLGIFPKFGPSIDDTPINIYLRQDIQHITSRLVYSTVYNRPSRTMEGYLAKMKSKELLRVSELLKVDKYQIKYLVKSNILKLDCTPPSKCFRIEDESLTNLLNKINNQNYISVADAIKITNSPKNWFYKYWVVTGFIEIIDLCIWKLVKKEDIYKILEIKKDFFTGKEASDFLGMPHSHITNLVSQNLISPYAFGSKNIVKLFKKTDVFYLKEKGYGY
ncbi:TniQ family protein [Acinetobacter sp. ANC 4636]